LQLKQDVSEHPLHIKNISIHDSSQVSKLKDSFLHKEPIILITKLPLKSLQEETSFINEIYSVATKNNYSIFRLGEQRIIVAPNTTKIEEEVL
jgi:SepF-like predicted cell division protein (DUF552 family)